MGATSRLAGALACVAGLALGCTGDDPTPHTDTTVAGGQARLRRLSAREYTLTIEDLLGEQVPAARLPDDASSTGYDNGASNLTVQLLHAEIFADLAEMLARTAVERHRDRL